jgi:hypothetical protein
VEVQTSPIQIGDINLQDFEVPPSIQFGGRHRIVVHKLSGGGRALERLGPDDGDIYFSGTFSGRYAEARMRAMNNLRLTGEVVWLTWESFRYQVVVRTFVAAFHSPWWIPYHVSCVLVHQPGATKTDNLPSNAQAAGDLARATATIAGTDVQLGVLQAAMAAPNVCASGTLEQAQGIAAVKSCLTAIDKQIAQSSSSLDAPLEKTVDGSAYQQALNTKIASARALAAAVIARAYIGRIGPSLASGRGSYA